MPATQPRRPEPAPPAAPMVAAQPAPALPVPVPAPLPVVPGGPDAYDPVADVYDRFWGDLLAPSMLAVLDRLLASIGTEGRRPRLLDLCCGTGQLAAGMLQRGWSVVGVDGSAAMLAHALRRAPEATIAQADVRAFDAVALVGGAPFDAAVCAFDSLNHMPDATALEAAFACVHRALRPGGRFVFDVNVREGFEERFQGTLGFADAELVCVVRAGFDGTHGRYDLTVLRAEGQPGAVRPPPAHAPDSAVWRRTDATLIQRCFSVAEILAALDAAGFPDPTVLDAESDLDMEGHIGRAVFVVDRPLT